MASLPRSVPLTRDDLDALPDDGHRYEILDGSLIVTPAPVPRHQMVVGELHYALKEATAGTGLVVFVAPFEVTLSLTTVLQPDVVVCHREAITRRGAEGPPVLVVEVLSPSTRYLDRGAKRLAYESAGVAHYWLADPADPSLVALCLEGGRYAEVASVGEDQTWHCTDPVTVSLSPTLLLGPLAG